MTLVGFSNIQVTFTKGGVRLPLLLIAGDASLMLPLSKPLILCDEDEDVEKEEEDVIEDDLEEEEEADGLGEGEYLLLLLEAVILLELLMFCLTTMG
jgi:hypothetical protein